MFPRLVPIHFCLFICEIHVFSSDVVAQVGGLGEELVAQFASELLDLLRDRWESIFSTFQS